MPECADLDVLEARGVDRGTEPPATADIIWSGGEGGLSVTAGGRDPELFEPLRAHLGTSTSSTAGYVRWSVIIGLNRLLLVEHTLPVTVGQTIVVDNLLDNVVFTGGGDTPTWWDDRWMWVEGGATDARAVLTDAFDTELSSTAVTGTLEVREVDPVVLRAGLAFTTERGQEVYWGDIEFAATRGVTFCR